MRAKVKEFRRKNAEPWEDSFDRILADVISKTKADPLPGGKQKTRNLNFTNNGSPSKMPSGASGGMDKALVIASRLFARLPFCRRQG